MVILAATGGSGSSFVTKRFRNAGWKVCQRPDNGSQKDNMTVEQMWRKRTKHLITQDGYFPESDLELFNHTYNHLKSRDNGNLLLTSMVWGGLGFLRGVPETVIYLIRHPVYTLNSYSGLGWSKKDDGMRRIKLAGASGPNDPEWARAFFGEFSHWKDLALNAYEAYCKEGAYIVRYDRFKEDWEKIPDVPPIHKDFENKDTPGKIKLSDDMVIEVMDIAGYIWKRISEL